MTPRTVTSFIACCSLALAAAACQPLDNEGSEFANGVPRQNTVSMTVPGSSAQPLTAESDSIALLGQTAEWYLTTRSVSFSVNSGAIAVGTLVKIIVNYPPTSVTADSAVWGPWKGPLDPVEWKVTITRTAPHKYQYKFEGRDKHAPTAAYVTILSGEHSPALDAQGKEMEGFGSGNFLLDWDTRATLPAPDDNVGTASYVYSHMGPGQVVNITANFRKVKDDKQPGRRGDVDYVFVQNPGAEGSMDFLYTVTATLAAAGGQGKVKSRWQWNGAGRSDVSVTPTDIKLVFTLSECWDDHYASVYKSVPLSSKPEDNYGSESDCAFTTPQYSSLK